MTTKAEKSPNPHDKVPKYEQFLNETLRNDLRKILEERDQIYKQLSEHLQLCNTIERIKEGHNEKESLKTQVDLGCNFFVQAKVDDPSRIYICVGYGFFVEMTLTEATKFLKKKVAHLTTISQNLTTDAAKIKAHIKLVLEGLREIQNIGDKPAEKPRRDI